MTDPLEYYRDHYIASQRTGAQGWGNSLVDRTIEKRRLAHTLPMLGKARRTLEIGASSGEHLRFVRLEHHEQYIALDLHPALTNPALCWNLRTKSNVDFVAGDARSLPFADETFDTALSTCVLAHVREPERVLAELRRVTRAGGQVIVGMPCDPGLLNRMVKVAVTYRQMRAAGVTNPRLNYAREHINGISNLVELARYVFREDTLRFHWFPSLIPSWNLNLICTLVAVRNPT